jgi:hypothetical protein
MFGITLFSQKMPALSLLSLTSVRENQRPRLLQKIAKSSHNFSQNTRAALGDYA